LGHNCIFFIIEIAKQISLIKRGKIGGYPDMTSLAVVSPILTPYRKEAYQQTKGTTLEDNAFNKESSLAHRCWLVQLDARLRDITPKIDIRTNTFNKASIYGRGRCLIKPEGWNMGSVFTLMVSS
jgi:hypothetical protein